MIPVSLRAFELLAELTENNNQEWYAAHKKEIESELVKPSRKMGAEIHALLQEQFTEQLDIKYYRMNRDIRFSRNKNPYNNNVRLSLWKRGRDPEEAPCFHFSVEAFQMTMGCGMWVLGDKLEAFRERIEEVQGLIPDVFDLMEPELKRIPKGYSVSPEAEIHLRRKGFIVWLPTHYSAGESGFIRY